VDRVEEALTRAISRIGEVKPKGTPDDLRHAARFFAGLSDRVEKSSWKTDENLETVICNTSGTATNAFREYSKKLEYGLADINGHAYHISDCLDEYATQLTGAHNEIESLLAELRQTLATYRKGGSLALLGGDEAVIHRAEHLTDRAHEVVQKVAAKVGKLASEMLRSDRRVNLPASISQPHFKGSYEMGRWDTDVKIKPAVLRDAAHNFHEIAADVLKELRALKGALAGHADMVGNDTIGKAFDHGYSPAVRSMKDALYKSGHQLDYTDAGLLEMVNTHETHDKHHEARMNALDAERKNAPTSSTP
jgi:hypothetical protein